MRTLLRARSLRFWVALSLALALVPLAFSAVAGFFLLDRGVIAAFRDVTERQDRQIIPVQHLRLLVMESAAPVAEYVDGADGTRPLAYRALRQKIEAAFSVIDGVFSAEPQIGHLIDRARAGWTAADEAATGLISVPARPGDPALLETMERFDGQIAAVTDTLSAAYDRLSADIDTDQRQASLFYERALWVAGIAAGLSLLAALGGILLIGRIISASVDRLVDGTARVAEGDRAYRIDVQVPPELHRVAEEFNRMVGRIQRSEEMLSDLAHRDGLTRLLNRRAFDEALAEALSRTDRRGESVALLSFDVDHFKHVNDVHGHAAGDEVLKAIADAAQSQLRPSDKLFRVGGEEFAVLLDATGLAGAAEAAERVRLAIRSRGVAVREGTLVTPTVSIGVAAVTGPSSREALTERADAALYRAKNEGRDRVVVDGLMPGGREEAA